MHLYCSGVHKCTMAKVVGMLLQAFPPKFRHKQAQKHAQTRPCCLPCSGIQHTLGIQNTMGMPLQAFPPKLRRNQAQKHAQMCPCPCCLLYSGIQYTVVKAVGVPLMRRSEAEEGERLSRLAEVEAELGAPRLARRQRVSDVCLHFCARMGVARSG